MKKRILTIFLFFTIFSGFIKGQIVDSVSVRVSKNYNSSPPYQYDYQLIDSFSHGLKKSSLLQHWENNAWVNFKLDNFSYQGLVHSQKYSQYWDSTQWENGALISYFISPDIDSTIEQRWSGSWYNLFLDVLYRDMRGLDSLILKKKWNTSAWDNMLKTENTFAIDSSFLTQIISEWDTVLLQWNYESRYLWLKDSLNRDTAYIEQYFLSGDWLNYMGDFYSYDSLGSLIIKTVIGWDSFDSSWAELRNIYSYTYDSLNRVVLIHVDNFPGQYSELAYTYDSLGVLINEHSYYVTMGGIVSENNDHIYYYTIPSASQLYILTNDDFYICSIDSSYIGAFAFGGTSPLHFGWSPSAGLSSDTIENPIVNPDSTTLYTVIVTDNLGNSQTEQIIVAVLQTTEILSIESSNTSCIGCNDGRFILGLSDSLLHFINISPNPGAVISNDTIYNLPPGVYTICVNNINSCTSCVIDTIFDDNTLVPENGSTSIVLYPNPFSESAQLLFNIEKGNAILDIVDSYGRLVKCVRINSSVTTISSTGLNKGTYFGILRQENFVLARIKIVFIGN